MTARINTGTVDCLLQQSFAEGVRWPIDRASLRALFDLGSQLGRSHGISRSIRLRSKSCSMATSHRLDSTAQRRRRQP
jgi:hypothetical protein